MKMQAQTSKITLTATPRADLNRGLLEWIYEKVKGGYMPPLDVKELEKFIERIVSWYEIKYPSRNAVLQEGEYTFLKDNLTEEMTISRLRTCLSKKEQEFFDGFYRMGNGTDLERRTIYVRFSDDDGNTCYVEAYASDGYLDSNSKTLAVKKEDESFSIKNLKDAIIETETLEDLAQQLEWTILSFDTTDLLRVLRHHELDFELRGAIFKLVTLALQTETPENTQIRKKRAELWMKEIGLTMNDPTIAEPQDLAPLDTSSYSEMRANIIERKISNRVLENIQEKNRQAKL